MFTAKGLSGEIPYDEWLRLDTSLWTGTPRSVLVRHLHENPICRVRGRPWRRSKRVG